jgi:hypothetical protein
LFLDERLGSLCFFLGLFHRNEASGRDQNAVTKDGQRAAELIQPDGDAAISDEDIEWAVRLA